MEDGLLKLKYSKLLENLKSIRSNLYDLDEEYDELEGLMKETLLINDKLVEEDLLSSIGSNNKKVINEINNNIIPSINSKL